MHEIVQRAMTDDAKALAVYNEVAVDIPALGITGHCDTLLEFAPIADHDFVHMGDEGPFDCDVCGDPRYTIHDPEYELLEFKSISPKGMNYGDLPKKEHVSQARTYAYGLRHVGGWIEDSDEVLCREDECPDPFGGTHGGHIIPLGDKLQRIRLAYFNRDDLEIREFVLPVDEEWERGLEAKIARLSRYEDTDLPPRLPLERGKKNWLCGYCQFRSKCWGTDPEGVEL